MSEAPAANTAPKRRAPKRRGPRKPRPAAADGAEKVEGGEEKKPSRVPADHVPVPPSLIGKSCLGRVHNVMMKGRTPFGWIYIDGGNAEMPIAETPRVYFSFRDYAEAEEYPARKGWQVEFDVTEDEEKRPYAKSIKLTAKGVETAKEHKAKVEALKAARPPTAEGEEEGKLLK